MKNRSFRGESAPLILAYIAYRLFSLLHSFTPVVRSWKTLITGIVELALSPAIPIVSRCTVSRRKAADRRAVV